MKKVLLASAVAVALGVGATAAHADDPLKLTLSGNMVQWVGYVGSDKTLLHDEGVTDYNTFQQYQDADFVFSGTTKLDNGLTVGATIDLKVAPSLQETGQSSTFQTNEPNALSYITIAGAFGQINAGRSYDVVHDNAIDAPEEGYLFVSDGYWGDPLVDGGFLNSATGNATGRTVAFDQNSSTNIRYTTPKFSGFQAGVDYGVGSAQASGGLGNLASSSALSTSFNNDSVPYKEAVHAVITYSGEFGDFKPKAFVGYAGEYGKSVSVALGGVAYNQTTYNLNAYNGGVSITYKGFTLAGSAIERSAPSGGPTTNAFKAAGQDGTTWDVGLAYESGPWGVSIAYMNSQAPDLTTTTLTDTFQFYEIGAHYTLGPGITLNGNVWGQATKADWSGLTGGTFNAAGSEATASGVGALISTNVSF